MELMLFSSELVEDGVVEDGEEDVSILLVEYEDDVSKDDNSFSTLRSIVGSKGFIESCLERRTLRSFLFNLHL